MNKKKLKVLFITRKYPPSIGGMQTVNYNLHTNLKPFTEIIKVSWGKSQKWLLLAYPYLFLNSLVKAIAFNPDIIHLGDGMLAPMGLILKKITGKRVTCTVHGLDISFSFPGYQRLILFCLSKIDKVFCVSSETQKEAIGKGLKKEKTVVIPNGVDLNEYLLKIPREKLKKQLESVIGIDLKDKKILLTVGRLVKRKGHQWFIENVIPKLKKNIIYLIAGDGPEKEKMKMKISNLELENRVFVLGLVQEDFKKILYNTSDIFIMPNIKVKGDMEGFGIVILEASSCGLFTIGSKIEGINDAIENEKNGFLVKSKNEIQFLRKINELLKNSFKLQFFSASAKEFSKSFAWEKIATKYVREFDSLLQEVI